MTASDTTQQASAPMVYAGVCGARYRVQTSPWTGPDYSRVCWVFPGQGSATPEMFAREFRELPIFRDRLAEVDALSVARGLPPVTDFLASRPIPAEVLPIVRLLALFTAEVAVADYLWAKGHRPAMATAFSFGEITAFATLGVVSVATAVDLICRREELSPPPYSLGQLVATSATPEALRAALVDFEFNLSIFATPGQTVVALRNADVAPAQKALRRARIAARLLKDVAQPHHSPWMTESTMRLRDYIAGLPLVLGPLRVPFFSSVLHRLVPAGPVAREVFAATVSEGLIEPVDFVAQIRAIRAAGCFGFREVGPGEVCSRYIEDILPPEERRIWPLARSLPAVAEAKPQPVLELTAASHRLLGPLARAIGRITGYELESISIEKRFQEDLGIDSIKKADILFTVVREAELPAGEDLNVSAIRTVADAVRFLEQTKSAPATDAPKTATHAEFFRHVWRWRPSPLPPSAPANRPVYALPWSELAAGRAPAVVAFLAQLGAAGGDLVIVDDGAARGDASHQLALATLWLREHVAAFSGARLNLALVLSDATAWPMRACGALLKSLVRETPALVCRIVHCDVWPGQKQALAWACREFEADGPIEVRYEKGARLNGELVRVDIASVEPPQSPTVAIAFGGARGITHALLRALTVAEIGELHVVGRTSASDPMVVKTLGELAAEGRVVAYHALDAVDPVAVEKLFAEVHGRSGRIDLVLNGAGIERSTLLAQKTEAEIGQELAGKLGPALAIDAAARRWTPRRLMHFSSLSARFGNVGQTVYALASQAVDELARDFAREFPGCTVLSLHWPGWDGVGMTAAPAVREALAQSRVALLAPDDAVALFRRELGGAPSADVVVDYHAPQSTWGFELGLRDLRSLAPLLGGRQGMAGFVRPFALGHDGFLRDHVLEGRAYFPAALGVVMCRALASRTGMAGPLKDFQMHAPLPVDEAPVTLTLQAQAGDDGRPRLVGRTTTLHFSCSLHAEREDRPARRALCPWVERIAPATLYRPDAIFHGPAFQVLHTIGVDQTGATVAGMKEVRLGPMIGLKLWDRLLQAVDGCFQLAGLDGWRRHRVMTLPIGIGRIWFSDTELWPERVELIAGVSRLEDDTVLANVCVVDAQGEPLLDARDLRLRVLRRDVAPPGLDVKAPLA